MSNRPLTTEQLLRQFPPKTSAGKSRAAQIAEAKAAADRARMRVKK